MNADRTVLTDGIWARIKDTLPGRKSDPGATAADNASSWRPFSGGSARGRPGAASRSGPAGTTASPGGSGGGTVVQTHRKAAGAEGGPRPGDRASGRRPDHQGRGRGGRAGISREVRDPSRLGARPEGVPELPGGLPFGTPVGDGASGADWLLEDLERRGAEAVSPARRNRTARRGRDRDVYGWRRLVESFFAKTGEFRAIATRYDWTDGSFAAGIHPVAGVVAAR